MSSVSKKKNYLNFKFNWTTCVFYLLNLTILLVITLLNTHTTYNKRKEWRNWRELKLGTVCRDFDSFKEAIGLRSRLQNAATTNKGHPWIFPFWKSKVFPLKPAQ